MTVASPESQTLTAALAPALSRLLTPALVIDLDAVEHNVQAMLARAGDARRWRPHVKTVKQAALVDLLLAAGVRDFKCALPNELELVLDRAGVRGVRVHALLAYPPSVPVLRRVRDLGRLHPDAEIAVLADSPDHLAALHDGVVAEGKGAPPLAVLLDVDTGMHRTGSPAELWEASLPIVRRLGCVRIAGVHAYEGHLGWAQREVAEAGYGDVARLARALGAHAELVVTSGSHSFAHALASSQLSSGPWRHQVSPGTVVLGDARTRDAAQDLGLRQAAFVASRVASTPQPGCVTLDAGSKALSPDRTPPGELVDRSAESVAVSEEHWTVRLAGTLPRRGDLLWIVPAHVCTTVNLHRRVLYLRGGRLAGEGEVQAAGHDCWA